MLSDFLTGLTQIATFVLAQFSSIFNVYTTTFLVVVIGMWFLRRVLKLFKLIS